MSSEGKIYNSEEEYLPSKADNLKATLNARNSDALNFEKERIKTYALWPIHCPVDPTRLAKSGFYYTGSEDEVICFSCHGCIKHWNYGDIVQKKHADLFPHCDFINGRSNNIPLSKNYDPISNLKTSENLVTTKSSKVSNVGNYPQMKVASERLKTFIGKWPLPYIDIKELAYAGFFYLGFDDKVQCPYCKVIVSCWEKGDEPLKEHQKHFPSCEYLINPQCEKSKNMYSWFQSPSSDVCGNMEKNTLYDSEFLEYKLLDKSQQHMNLKKLGVHLHKGPAHPQQAALTARLRSFTSWPQSAPVSKEDLAEAGFFYIGISDHTKCFHCNGGLCNWEDGDDPWVEHARWFFNCDFLHLTKGSDFIQSCLKKFPSTRTMDDINKTTSVKGNESLVDKVDEAMNSVLVKYVMETGLFPSYVIRAAVLRQIYETGSAFSNIDELCVAVSHLKEEMEKEPFKIGVKSSDLNICEKAVENLDISEDPHLSTLKGTSDVMQPTCAKITLVEDQSKEKSRNDVGENQSSTENSGESLLKDQCLCKICMDQEVGVVFLPCGHLLSCTVCAPALKFCPMCRKTIQATVRAYLN